MQRQLLLPALIGAVLILVGCDDEISSPDSNTLSASDAEAIADQTAATVIAAMEAGFTADVGLAESSAIPVDFTRENTRPCPAGGDITASVSVTGDVNQGGPPSELTIEGSTVFNECTRETEGATITLDGQLQHSGTVTITETDRGAEFTITGELSLTVEPGDPNACTVDLTVTFGDGAHGVTGTVCGQPVGNTS